jgi:hypothetical protein
MSVFGKSAYGSPGAQQAFQPGPAAFNVPPGGGGAPPEGAQDAGGGGPMDAEQGQ